MDNTEQKILTAARKTFITKGLDGARMQEIADNAGINKALLHYYFRSKLKLFEIVLKDTISDFIPEISSILNSNLSIEDKIRGSIKSYFTLLKKNPDLPPFIIREINRDPSQLFNIVIEINEVKNIKESFAQSFSNNKRIPGNPFHFLTSVLSMIIFPFATKPLLKMVLFNDDETKTQEYFDTRQDVVIDYALKLLKQ